MAGPAVTGPGDANGAPDPEVLGAWLAARGIPARGLTVTRLSGGSSNPTYRVRAEATDLVLRRPPLTGRPATAHDMDREYRFQEALAGTAIPVPRVVGMCADPAVLGVPFYVMEHLDGVVYGSAGAVRDLDPAAAREVGLALARTLAALHSVDPAGLGLSGFAREEPYVTRQLRRWRRQWETAAPDGAPLVGELLDALDAAAPGPGPVRIVHGDYNLGNVMYDRRDPARVRAVLDWEMAAIGEPQADLGQLLAYRGAAGRLLWARRGGHPPDANAGFPQAGELLREYAGAGGPDAGHVTFWEAFAVVKLAVICAGALRRTADPPTAHREQVTALIGDLAALARDTLHK